MKRFQCPNCSNEVYLDSRSCEKCGKALGYVPYDFTFITLSADASGGLSGPLGGQPHRLCQNARHDACNWLVADGDGNAFCVSCRHNRLIPDLSIKANLEGWRALELAKRQMFYSLLRWRLPIPTIAEQPAAGLVFDVLADAVNPDGSVRRALTGHDNGRITINVAEADEATREKTRSQMREPYRMSIGATI